MDMPREQHIIKMMKKEYKNTTAKTQTSLIEDICRYDNPNTRLASKLAEAQMQDYIEIMNRG